jgi:hypothetical protein
VLRDTETIRIPSLRAVVVALATLVAIGLVVFLRRYRGADRTAMALSLLVGGGICLVAALAWFQRQFGRTIMRRRDLWEIGLRWGALAGACTSGIGIGLLAARWAIDQGAGPAGDTFLPAFQKSLAALAAGMLWGLPAYLAVGALVGALAGLAVAQAIGMSAGRPNPSASLSPDGPRATGPRTTDH